MRSQQLFHPNVCRQKASKNDIVTVHYLLRLGGPKGKLIDNSFESGEKLKFQIGSDKQIQGLSYAVSGMCRGERKKVKVPPNYAFGDLVSVFLSGA